MRAARIVRRAGWPDRFVGTSMDLTTRKMTNLRSYPNRNSSIPPSSAALVGFDIASPIIKKIPHRGRADDSVNLPFTFPKKLIIEFGEPILLDRHYDASYSKEQEFRISNEEIRPRLLELLQKYQKMECDPWPAPE